MYLDSENWLKASVEYENEKFQHLGSVVKHPKESEWLLHEAFCLYSQRDIFDPYEKHHSTVKDACELAEKLSVKNLLLYHTEDKNLPDRARLCKEEGARYYHGNLFVPDDLEYLEL